MPDVTKDGIVVAELYRNSPFEFDLTADAEFGDIVVTKIEPKPKGSWLAKGTRLQNSPALPNWMKPSK